MDKLEAGPFTAEVDLQTFVVRRGDAKVSLAPGEAAAAIQLIHMSRQMEKFKALPPKLAGSPWEVRFNEEGIMEWIRENAHDSDKGVTFNFNEADGLVVLLQDSVQKFADVSRIRGGASSGVAAIQSPEPPIEGR